MQDAVRVLMSGSSDAEMAQAEKEIERWDAAIRMHPEYEKEQQREKVRVYSIPPK